MENLKNEGCKSYLGNKEKKRMFLVVSQSGAHFGYEHLCPIGHASKTARPKNWTARNKISPPLMFIYLADWNSK